MKIIIDVLTPKQGMFFPKLSDNLEKRGHQVTATTRRYREVTELLELKGIEAMVVGEHGGKDLSSKLKASAQRTLELTALFEEIEPDVSISFLSPEMARVSYGLKVPHILIGDSPHAEAVARLTVPLASRLLTPKMIPKKAWTGYGIASERIVQYNALDSYVWLKDFKPDQGILEKLGLHESRPVVTVRTAETFAAYLLGKTQEETSVFPIVRKLLEKRSALQIVVLPRYTEQINALRDSFRGRVTLCESVVDGPSLLYHTAAFVGAGGTMNEEAALLGVPTLSCYPGEPSLVEKCLITKKLVRRETDPEEVVKWTLKTVSKAERERKRQTEKARRLLETFEDPVDAVAREVERFA